MHWHIKRLSTPCGGQPESQFGAVYLKKITIIEKKWAGQLDLGPMRIGI